MFTSATRPNYENLEKWQDFREALHNQGSNVNFFSPNLTPL